MSSRSDRGRSAGVARAAACAPWVRTRLRTAPAAACALGLLVLVTAFLAAAFPRAVDTYESKGCATTWSSRTPGAASWS